MIRKEAFIHKSVIEELKRIIEESEVMQEDDALWPPPDRVGRQVNIYFVCHIYFKYVQTCMWFVICGNFRSWRL